MRCLIVEDDIDTQAYIQSRLEERSFAVDTTTNGNTALDLTRTTTYDIILLDYDLPGKNGFEVCQTLRSSGNTTPIIMISVTGVVDHKIQGLGMGIDDYVSKPFFFEELFARIQAVLRRPKQQLQTLLGVDDLSLNPMTQQVMRTGEEVYLTKKEFSLLEYLLRHRGKVLSKETLIDHVWDATIHSSSNSIETHILNLRKKIDHPPHKKLIYCIPGRGYRIDNP